MRLPTVLPASRQGQTLTPPDAQAVEAPPLPLDPAVRVGTLENGLRYYIRKNAEPENRAALRLAVAAGSALEEDSEQGLAHFVEHMAFNGTERFAKREIDDFLEKSGVKFGKHTNAYTSFDQTVYMLQVPTGEGGILERGVEIMEQFSHAVSFDDDEVDKERGVVIEEWRSGNGAQFRVLEKQFPVFFKGSRYAERLPIGKVDILKTVKPEGLRGYYKRWYRPDNMAFMAVGDFDPDAVESLVKTYFGAVPNRPDPLVRPAFDMPDHSLRR